MEKSRRRTSLDSWALSFFGLSAALIISLFLIRLVVDTSFRLFYPFVPQLSEGLQVSITVFGWLLMIRSGSAFFSPLIGTLADKYGRRKIMASALVAQGLGMAGVTFTQGGWAILPLFLTGLALNAYLPAQQAYISDLAPYERRGRSLASIDIAFAFSGVVLMPLVGWLMNSYGWRVPFWALSALSFFAAFQTWFFLPETKTRTVEKKTPLSMRELLGRRNIQASLLVAIFLFVGVGIFMTFWGIWLSAEFAFSALDLGLMAQQIGFAELLGAVLAGLVVDKFGKRRTSLVGVLIAGLMFLYIPFAGENLLAIRGLLIITVFWIELSIVALFPLYGEQAPNARATIFSLIALGNGVGLALGPVVTTALWNISGISTITTVAGLCLGLAFFLIAFFLFDEIDE